MIEVIVTIVTILGGVVTLLSYFSKEKVRVTICCTESTLLTQKPKIPGITVFVQYEDTIPVENLWRICIIRKSKFPQNPKRSVRFSGKRTKRSVQKRKARNTQKAETKVL